MRKTKDMYSLNNPHFNETFSSINELTDYVLQSGADPNYEVTKNGVGIGEELIDFIVY